MGRDLEMSASLLNLDAHKWFEGRTEAIIDVVFGFLIRTGVVLFIA